MSSGHCLSISSILVSFTVKLSTLAGKWTLLALGLHHMGLASLFPDQQKFLVWFSLVWLGSSAHDWNDDYSQEGKLTEWSGLSGRSQEMGQPHQDGLRVGRELLLFSKGKLGSGPTRRGMTSKQANEKRGPLPTSSPLFLMRGSSFRSQLKMHPFRNYCPDPWAKPQPLILLLYF